MKFQDWLHNLEENEHIKKDLSVQVDSKIWKLEIKAEVLAKKIEEIKNFSLNIDWININEAGDIYRELWEKNPYKLYKTLYSLLEKSIFWDIWMEEFFNLKIEELKKLWVDISNIKINEKKISIKKSLREQAKKLYQLLFKSLWKEKIKDLSSVKISWWKIQLFNNTNFLLEIYTIKIDEHNWLFLKKEEGKDINKLLVKQDKENKELKSKRELFFKWSLAVSFWYSTVAWVILLNVVEFFDPNWKKHKLKLNKEVSWWKEVALKEALLSIKEKFWYNVKHENWEIRFEDIKSKIDVVNIRQKLNNISFEDFKEAMKDSSLSKEKLEFEYSRHIANANSFLNLVEKQYWRKVSLKEFSMSLLKESTTWKFWLWVHVILYPIFFAEVHKNWWNLDSYFIWASEMILFNSWALFVGSKLQGTSQKLMKMWLHWKVLSGFLQLAWWLFWWAFAVSSWKGISSQIWLKKWYDTVSPDSYNYFEKNWSWKNSSIISYIWTWWYAYEIADYLWTDIWIKWTPITFWKNEVDLSTEKEEYMSTWLTRTKDFYNNKLEEYSSKLIWNITQYIDEYTNFSNWIARYYEINDEIGYNYTKEEVLKNRKDLLEKKIYKFIYKWENWGIESNNKKIKDSIYNIIISNIDRLISWWDILEIHSFILAELDNLKINNGTIKELEEEIIYKKELLETILIWKRVEITNSEKLSFSELSWRMAPKYMIDYIESLSVEEREYLNLYYKRILETKKIVTNNDYTWDDISIWRSWVKKETYYDRLIRDKSTIELPDWRILSKWDIFHQITLLIKWLKENIDFIERIKKDESNKDVSKIKWLETINYKNWEKIIKYGWWIEIVSWKRKIFIKTKKNWMLEYIQSWYKKFTPNIKWLWDWWFLIWGKKIVEYTYIYPFVFINSNSPTLTFRRANSEINSKFVRSEDISIEELFNMLENKWNPILMEDYELYHDLELTLDK